MIMADGWGGQRQRRMQGCVCERLQRTGVDQQRLQDGAPARSLVHSLSCTASRIWQSVRYKCQPEEERIRGRPPARSTLRWRAVSRPASGGGRFRKVFAGSHGE
jgi:hypothetical protein